jgi:hypothetical protein
MRGSRGRLELLAAGQNGDWPEAGKNGCLETETRVKA